MEQIETNLNNASEATTVAPKKRFTNRKRQKVQAVNLIKTFDTFEAGYKEIIDCCPIFSTYCGSSILYESVIDSICKTIKENIPSPTNRNYPNTLAFSINSHEVGLKTDSGSAIGWRIVFDKESGKTVYKFRLTFINHSTYVKSVISALESAGWTTLDIQSSKSRFWNSIDRKNSRRKYRPHYQNNKQFNSDKEVQEQSPEVPKDTAEPEKEQVSVEQTQPVKEEPVEIDVKAENDDSIRFKDKDELKTYIEGKDSNPNEGEEQTNMAMADALVDALRDKK